MRDYLYKLATDKQKGILAYILKLFLFISSCIYGLLIRAIIFLRSSKKKTLGCKVISVGNITLGGTGKTSLVKIIAVKLQCEKHKVAVLTRGYRKKGRDAGDEPTMLMASLKDVAVIVDKNRVRGARVAVDEYGADTVILDDGMQQWGIKKDLEIIAINALEGFGNRQMLPRGILREPLSSLIRADIFVLTKVNLSLSVQSLRDALTRINPRALIVEASHRAIGLYNANLSQENFFVDYLKDKQVALFSGIGDPASFSELIKNLGSRIGLDLRFPDHHYYTAEDLSGIIGEAENKGIKLIITTEKDAARLSKDDLDRFAHVQLLVLRIELIIVKNGGEFASRLLGLYSL
jgi:tetraacyldisaccharide 4'-kinase